MESGDSNVLAAIAELLTEHGPMTAEQLAEAVSARGFILGDDPDDLVFETLEAEDSAVVPLIDDRWAWLPSLLAGRVFTHRVSAAEATHDVLADSPDLLALSMLVENDTHRCLTDGAPIRSVLSGFDDEVLDDRGIPDELLSDEGDLLLPAGYLAGRGIRAGDLIGLRLTDGGLELMPVEEPPTTGPGLAALGTRLGEVLADAGDEPIAFDIAIWTACAEAPTLFVDPLPPLGQVLEACGLASDGQRLAGGGFDFRRWQTENRIASLARRYQLGPDEALAVFATVSLFDRLVDLHASAKEALDRGGEAGLAELTAELGPAPDPNPASSEALDRSRSGPAAAVRDTMGLLAEPAVADAVLAETLDAGADPSALGMFAEVCEPLARREARAALRWLRAKAYERLGEVSRAEDAYQKAQELDPNWPPTLLALARYASDRGDAERGLALLRRAGAPEDHQLVELLRQFQPVPRPELGRNQPCWCGSGRKYKVCHSRRERFPLAERAAWLYQKAGHYLEEGPLRSAVLEVAMERARHREEPDALLGALLDPLVGDALLFEGGKFAEFLAVRGALLPDDERLLAEQWLLVERSVYEVEDVRPGIGLTVRDVRTGDVHSVRELTASRQLKPGQLVCARVVPADDTMRFFGGVEPVTLGQRDELVALLDDEPHPVELVGFLSRRFAPASLQNTEGDPLVICEATLDCADPTALAAALDDTYERVEYEPGAPASSSSSQWHEYVTTQGMQRIRATLTLADDRLQVSTNSEARMDRVLGVVRGLGLGVTLDDETRQPTRDTRELARLPRPDGPSAAAVLDPAEPEVAAVMAQFIRDYERNWLDQELPALAGRTPRQAAADPTRRGDLARLLDGFPDDPALMSPDRLRAELGLG